MSIFGDYRGQERVAESDPAGPGRAVHEHIAEEAAAIAATPQFVRSPVMMRLLEFLVAETLAGRGDQLKAYAVAVDGLGRRADFDAGGDSYPRVQVGRLRKMLDAHYARHAPASGMRLSIPSGGYRVTLDHHEAEGGKEGETGRSFALRWRWLAAAAAVILLAGALLFAARMFLLDRQDKIAPPLKLVPPPMLQLGPVVVPHSDPARREALLAILLDELARTDMVELTVARGHRGIDPAPIAPRYALTGTVTDGVTQTLFLRLWRIGPDRLIWSERVALPRDVSSFAEALAPALATLTQRHGVIATNERAEWGRNSAPGYPCMLRFHQYRDNGENRAEVARCMAQTLRLDPGHAPALAASSMLAVDEAAREMPGSRRSAGAVARARTFARRAVLADRFDASAHYALARTSVYADACPEAASSAIRAASLAPYDPPMLANIAALLINCLDARGEALARRAIALDPDVPAYHGPLVYLAIWRDDAPAARDAAMRLDEGFARNLAFHHLTIAVAHAAHGDLAGARAAWRRVEAIDPAVTRDPDALFRRARFSTVIREKCLAHLRRAGLVPPAPPAAPHP